MRTLHQMSEFPVNGDEVLRPPASLDTSESAARNLDGSRLQPMIIDGEYHPAVSFDYATALVCKRIQAADATERAERTTREFEFLRRFSTSLANESFLRCARPVHADPERGRIWMTYCPGSQLHHLLAEGNEDLEAHLDHLAEQIARALEMYLTEFDQPFSGLATWNILYQPSIRTLSLLDISGPIPARDGLDMSMLERSLGSLIASSIYHTVRARRGSWRNLSYWYRLERILVTVLDELKARHTLRPSEIREASVHEYALRAAYGRPIRRAWLTTVGRALFRYRLNRVMTKSLAAK